MLKKIIYRGGTTQAFTGSGTAAQSNSMTGTISVTIVRVYPNGNLEVKGQRKLNIIVEQNI